MRKTAYCLVAIILITAGMGAASADNVTGADKLLCSVNIALLCTDDGECEAGTPWSMNLPEFIEVHISEKMLSTTKTSSEKRITPINHLGRSDGAIFVHGNQNGRAFSFVITEETGMVTYAVAAETMVITGFGACLPRS